MSEIPENTSPIRKRTLPKEAEPYKFKPGQSGNPGGRPKKTPITDLFEELYGDPEFVDLVRKGLRTTAKKGSIPLVMHLKDAAERLEGKVAQKVDVEVNGSLSLRVKKALERLTDE